MLRRVRQTYPNIAMIALQASGGGTGAAWSICDDQHEFDFTLDLLLDAS
jgi:hypothetical protein